MDVKLVCAIRDSRLVGTGSCTVIDECYEDSDISEALQRLKITTVAGALEWAIDVCDLYIEQALNCRFGDGDDPQLAMAEEWDAAKKNL